MNFPSRIGFAAVCSASSLLIVIFGGTAFAADKNLPANASRWMALDSCAAYGPNFTSVAGTHDCVKIGGHLRVEFGSQSFGGTLHEEWHGAGAKPAVMQTREPDSAGAGVLSVHRLRLRETGAAPYGASYLR